MNVQAFHDYLATGLTHVCQCWAIKRRDGVVLGFTDHDRPLAYDGITFVAESGMTARALSHTTGLSVDNTEAIGMLTADAVTEVDIAAGRYDQAEVTVWQVCWDDVTARKVKFRGTMGEITRNGGQFQVDLRGLAEALNQPQGRSYLKTCSAVLGDSACAINTTTDAAYVAEITIDRDTDGQVFDLVTLVPFNAEWFKDGFLEVMTGTAKGLSATIKADQLNGTRREVLLWQPLGLPLAVGDELRLVAGCDKRAETCREKFANLANFQGFPHIPGDDWLMAVPRSDGANNGGSLQ
jgi:uncharacterized phage protein (TIGR02218 family)